MSARDVIWLPVLGPSTVRDTAGSIVNLLGGDPWYNVSVKNNTQYFNEKIIISAEELRV